MTKEQLLIPRYKVVSEWPDMIERFTIGYIFEHPYGRQYLTETSKYDPADFPALFKGLEWWEERTIEDLPDYVKYQKLIYKAKDKFLTSVRCEAHPLDGKGLDAGWGSCLPATKAEYLSSLAQLETANR